MLLIDFFEITPINSLLPIRTMRPDRVAFLIDINSIDSSDAMHMEQAIHRIESVKHFSYVPIDPSDIHQMKERMLGIIDKTAPNEEVYIDITGGTDLMVASGYSIAMETNAIPIHIDIVNKEVFRVDTQERLGDIENISLKDYLTAIGAKQLRGSHGNPTDEDALRICEMAEVIFRRTSEWHALSNAIADCFSRKRGASSGSLKFTIDDRLVYPNKKGFNTKGLMKEFCRRGFVKYLGEKLKDSDERGGYEYSYEIVDPKYKEYMTIYGIWLEMYVYFKTKPHFDEAYLGMVIDWDNDDEIDTVDNEIDVALMKDSIPYFISCKMRRIEAADIYEIGFISERFGGEYARSFIASTHPMRRNKRGTKNLSIKMEKLNVGMIYVREEEEFNKLYKSQRVKSRVVEEDMEA